MSAPAALAQRLAAHLKQPLLSPVFASVSDRSRFCCSNGTPNLPVTSPSLAALSCNPFLFQHTVPPDSLGPDSLFFLQLGISAISTRSLILKMSEPDLRRNVELLGAYGREYTCCLNLLLSVYVICLIPTRVVMVSTHRCARLSHIIFLHGSSSYGRRPVLVDS